MGQHESKPTAEAVSREDLVDRRPRSRSASTAGSYLGRLRRLSWSRSTSSANHPSPRRRSIFGGLFRNKRHIDNHEENSILSNENVENTDTPPPIMQPPSVPQEPATSTSNEQVRATPSGTLMIMHGTMSPSEDSRPTSEQASSTIAEDFMHEAVPQPESRRLNTQTSITQGNSGMDERLQTSIDVLAALLSMATAATATSLLTGTTDVLATLSSDSSGGPQVLPARARVAWDTLENLFYLRSRRQTTMAPHIELFRDLTLAILTSRLSSTSLSGSSNNRDEQPPLQSGTFERFLVDLNASVRTSLREDYLQRGSDIRPEVGSPLGRLNWWRAYQFPSVNVSSTADSRFASSSRSTHPEVGRPPDSTTPRRGDEAQALPPLPGFSSSNSTGSLVPVVLVGLRSLSRDGASTNSSPSPSSPSNATGGTPRSSSLDEARGSDTTESTRGSLLDEVDAISSSYVIIVLGGHYPPEHRYALATGSEDSSDLDQLWELVDIVPPKPPTATADEISKSGLTCFKAGRISEMKVAENTIEKCLICLDDYNDDVELRLLSCSHAFHRECVDRWFIEGQNGCPLCRTQGVQR